MNRVYITHKWSCLLLCYAFNIRSLAHRAPLALVQCHLHFPRIHYLAVALCIAFIPQVAPHMETTHYIPSENTAVESCSTNHRLHCYLVITSLFYVWNHSTMGLQVEKANYLTNVHLLFWDGQDFYFRCSIFSLSSSTAGRQKEVRATEVLFGYLFMAFPFNIHVFFSGLSGCRAEFAALKAAGAKNQVSASMSPVDEGKRGSDRWIDREGTRERGFMCSLVNERLALKVTGCVYYWSVSRLMGSGEEERAELLSRDQSTQAWEQEEAPSNKLCHSRSACSHRSGDNSPACWAALAGNEIISNEKEKQYLAL